MQLGIDFGTTRTVVACADRGNYPIVGFEDPAGDGCDFFPSVVAARGEELRFGLDAVRAAAEPGWGVARSFKRLLSGPDAGPDRRVRVGELELTVAELLARFLAALREALLGRSNLPRPRGKKASSAVLSAVVAAPANAHGTQRFLTLDAFRRAGFEPRAMLNEPSAAGFEYTHRYRDTLTRTRELVLVYDLGGGTFDASLVRMSERHHDAVATAGIARLGGDDFDAILVDLALEAAGLDRARLSARGLDQLTERCREAKEALHPSTKRISLDLEACFGAEVGGAGEVTVPVADYASAYEPLVERTIDVMRPLVVALDDPDSLSPELAGIYVVGGASSLPIVGRLLRERFGRRVHRSPYPFAATAIGLAIAADEEAGFSLEDRFSRSFGVFREARGGHGVSFDPIFTPETRVPAPGAEAVRERRVYRAAHNVGHFRLIECSAVDAAGTPLGDITPAGEVLFPFDPALRSGGQDLRRVPVLRTGEGPLVEETYSIDPSGLVALTIRDLESGFAQEYRVGGR